jgi:predicted phage baseplate assembly protein
MSLPEVTLDDRRFQDLVDEARTRVGEACPEWTEHNVSDPGITLIELFAWMTEAIIYRLNRIPEKVHIALLDLLGIQLAPPTAASAELRFRLAAPADEEFPIPAETEVGTVRTTSEDSVVFQTSEDFTIPGLRPIAYVVEHNGSTESVAVAAGLAKPKGEAQRPFAKPPQVGDALYLGFDAPLDRLLLQFVVESSPAFGTGIHPDDPPLHWEVSSPEGGWLKAEVLHDSTGGFNYGSGVVELELHQSGPAIVDRRRAYWIRCRVDERSRSGAASGAYTQPPAITSITAAPIGALIPASHSAREMHELLGESDGTPGQKFRLRHAPVLSLSDGETLETRSPGTEARNRERWELVESFLESCGRDRHYTLDLVNGEVELGPAVRTADGGWRRYSIVPPKGTELRFTSYRHGGGRRGNVAANRLTTLKSAIPGVASVTNPAPAAGGIDAETLDSLRRRATMELRTRHRAVTVDDFEFLASEASPRVARAACVPPGAGGPVRVHILPRVEPANRKLALHELTPDEGLLAEVDSYLAERCVIGTSVQVLPVALRGVSVTVRVQASPNSDLQRVEQDVAQALYVYVNPIIGGSLDGPGSGWEFGRGLNQGELYGLVRQVEGVAYVTELDLYETDLTTGDPKAEPAGVHVPLLRHELLASGTHSVRADRRRID